MNRTTVIYFKTGHRQEKLMTLREFVNMGRLKAGQYILIGKIDESGRFSDLEGFWVGDCTPFHEPSQSDGGFGWDCHDSRMAKFVIEVHEHQSAVQ